MNIKKADHNLDRLFYIVIPTGFKPVTFASVVRCSIQLEERNKENCTEQNVMIAMVILLQSPDLALKLVLDSYLA